MSILEPLRSVGCRIGRDRIRDFIVCRRHLVRREKLFAGRVVWGCFILHTKKVAVISTNTFPPLLHCDRCPIFLACVMMSEMAAIEELDVLQTVLESPTPSSNLLNTRMKQRNVLKLVMRLMLSAGATYVLIVSALSLRAERYALYCIYGIVFVAIVVVLFLVDRRCLALQTSLNQKIEKLAKSTPSSTRTAYAI